MTQPEFRISLHPSLPNRTPEEERTHRKQRLAGACRMFAKRGFDRGLAGHITARDPERADCFWVNPVGVPFSHMRASHLLLVHESGKLLHGDRPIAPAAFAIHSVIHRLRPDVVAAAHAHSTYGRAFSTLGKMLAPLTQDACAFYEDHALYSEYGGPVFELDESERLAGALGRNKAVILRNHGLLTVGQSVEEAAWWFISMDDICHVQLLADAAGKTHAIDHETALATRAVNGTPFIGRLVFETLWERLAYEEPDVLE